MVARERLGGPPHCGGQSPTTCTPATLGRDSVLRFATGDWVEILDDHRELDDQPGEMRKIEVDVEDGTLSLAAMSSRPISSSIPLRRP